MKYYTPLDPHTHLRGNEYSEHDFLGMALFDADAVGLAGLIEMPNPQPWLVDEAACEMRRHEVRKRLPYPYHGIHIGLTNDKSQVISALELLMDIPLTRQLHADKIFYTHSTGNMGILDPEYQKWIWKTKAEIHYRGVSIGHFEDENEFNKDLPFNASYPRSHSDYQRSRAETVSVETQLRNAVDAGFRGTFYIAHCSNPETLQLVRWAKRIAPFKIVVEVTWHHLLLNVSDYETHGNLVKMNPPLRSQSEQKALLNDLLCSRIDDLIQIIATDHAPHPIERKSGDKPASGIPGILFWPRGIQMLREFGMREDHICDLTFNNANRIFNLGLQSREVEREYRPELWDRYGFNPFSRIDK